LQASFRVDVVGEYRAFVDLLQALDAAAKWFDDAANYALRTELHR